MTIPNVLTIFRILLTPLLAWLLLDNRLGAALTVFFLAGMTDGLDGLIARLFNQKSQLGAYLDPLADKLLLVSSFVLLGRLGLAPMWLVVITVSRDAIIILGLLTLMLHHVPIEIRPSIASKATTLAQLMTVLAILSSPYVQLQGWMYTLLFVSTGVLSVISGFHYVMTGLSLYEARGSQTK
jgi:cardiolipin synthase